jgi:hypothetical protein
MVSEARARELADEFTRGTSRKLAPTVTELAKGWYFAWEYDGSVGSHGLAVNKETGRVFVFGSAFPVERDLRMYDRGMDAERHDVVILEVANLKKTLAMLRRLAPTVVRFSYEHGTVWRIPRRLSEDELRARLTKLPAIFPDMPLYFDFEAVDKARSSRFCVLDVLPRTSTE